MSKIMSLDGDWQMKWDTEDAGISTRWYATNPQDTETVQVPHIWERAFDKLLMSQDCAFYFKRFTVEDEKQVAKRIFLRFERIASHATVWLNGKLLGTHFGAYTPFIIEPQKALKLGEENILCVRVANMGAANGRIDFGRESADGADDRYAHPGELPVGLPWNQYPFGGIFGHVDLILGTAAFISDVKLEPDADTQRVACEISFNNPRNYQTRLRVLMRNPDGDVYEHFVDNIKLDKENMTQRFVFEVKEQQRHKFQWSLEHPNLYAIEFQLEIKAGKEKDGKEIKRPEYAFPVVRTFGFRKFDCLKGDYYLNDQILKIQGITYNQQWSEGGLWTINNPKLEKDLLAVKKAGFNAIRSCGAPLPEAALDICDKLGLIVFQEFPIHTMRSTPKGLEIVKKLINDIVEEQHHHPCIGIWVMGAENGTLLLQNGNKLLNAISPVDMTRPVISNLNSIYLDNEGNFRKDTGKLLPVSIDKISTYATLRMNPRMTPNAAYSHYLAHSFDRDAEEPLSVPDTGLGDSHFQDEEENVANDINNKMLVTLKNHTLLPATATNITGPRSAKVQKNIKTYIKQIETFVESDMSVWKDYKSFIADANRIALKSKLDQITALQSNPQIAGFFLDQWADYNTEFCGLCDENRVSKGFDEFIQEITTPSRALISELEHVVAPQSEISFQLTLLNNSRYEDVAVEVRIIDEKGKEISCDTVTPEEQAGKTSLTQMGIYTTMAPRNEGKYQLKVTLKNDGKEIHSSVEDLIVIAQADVKAAMKKVCSLDDSEESSDALAALSGPEQVIFTANLSSWPDEILDKLVDVVKNGGKTLLLSDLTQDDIDYLNQSHQFDCNIESHWSTGANELSLHYLPKGSALASVFGEAAVLDHNAAAVMPSISLNELPGATVFARSVTLKDGDVKVGSDLQLYPFGNGKIMFNQFNVFEGLETNALADKLFATIVGLL
ncbi:glycoside hydrolase family 2 protein [uncultured Fibrobacter sp.]|uniref:glycoside hydrolase family 2 protein n=1 Tax=uncultured Fibrobacter sp. TaxID=261512 RepID=UPI00260D6C5E|nr:sugar-binding domain-containing protein [uncultured Fibrobacter sp.]